jgi:hypothetical protein
LGGALIIQSFRKAGVPKWIQRCVASVQGWAGAMGHDYLLTGDEVFALCGKDYLARANGNMRTITNLVRLELVKRAHQDGYPWAAWIDADVFVFDPSKFSISSVTRYAFARETWLEQRGVGRWRAFASVNNSVFVCRAGEPDLEFLIAATRHVALHRRISNNYQVGGDLIKGLRVPLAFETLSNVGMFSNYMVLALAHEVTMLIEAQARLHGAPISAANLCASENYAPTVGEGQVQTAMDRLETTRGAVLNDWLRGAKCLQLGTETFFDGPDFATFDNSHGAAGPGLI